MERSDWGSLSGDSLIDMACMVLRNATLTVGGGGGIQSKHATRGGGRWARQLPGVGPGSCARRVRGSLAPGWQPVAGINRPPARPPCSPVPCPCLAIAVMLWHALRIYLLFIYLSTYLSRRQVDSEDLSQCRDLWGRLAGADGRWGRDWALAALAAAQRTEISLSSFADTLYSQVQVGGGARTAAAAPRRALRRQRPRPRGLRQALVAGAPSPKRSC